MPFPEPIPLPPSVSDLRKKRLQEISKASKRGIFVRLAIIGAELLGVLLFGSSALLMDALSSSLDIAASILLLFGIRWADKPPDEDHPFGHGRYEPLIGLQLGLMLALIGGSMLIQQGFHLSFEKHDYAIDSHAWIIPAVAVILLEICYRVVMRTAVRENSPALAADAIHYRIDGLASLFATVALILGAFYPNWSLTFDHLGAILIAILMLVLGIIAAKKNIHQLMDRIPDPPFFERVKQAALRVAGVQGTEKIRIQLYGPDAHVDIDIEVDPQLSVELAHGLSQQVRAEIQKEWPAVRDVTVHIEPFYPGDH
jgi:cation diffusion facilitator family transporter